MELKIIKQLENKTYEHIGFGNTLLDCIYGLSSDKVKECLLQEVYDFYAYDSNEFDDENGDFDNDKYNKFITDLHQNEIDERIYCWCNSNNYNYFVVEE